MCLLQGTIKTSLRKLVRIAEKQHYGKFVGSFQHYLCLSEKTKNDTVKLNDENLSFKFFYRILVYHHKLFPKIKSL